MELDDPKNIINGNERVITPRLKDAQFFLEMDKKYSLSQRIPFLKKIVFQKDVGSQYERTNRITKLGVHLAQNLQFDFATVERAGILCKADLTTEMVGEFPELQGFMGGYYAGMDGEDDNVARAIGEHYFPRFQGDIIPKSEAGICVSLADKVDLLLSMFSIGKRPGGDKDPHALRRNGIGIVRILLEHNLNVNIHNLLNHSAENFTHRVKDLNFIQETHLFIMDRLKGHLKERGYTTDEIDSVIGNNLKNLKDLFKKLDAVKNFKKLDSAVTLISSNKRIKNILKKNKPTNNRILEDQLDHPSELSLFERIQKTKPQVEVLFEKNDFENALVLLAGMSKHLDDFFTNLMVVDPCLEKRNNRLNILIEMDKIMNEVVDISKIQIN